MLDTLVAFWLFTPGLSLPLLKSVSWMQKELWSPYYGISLLFE